MNAKSLLIKYVWIKKILFVYDKSFLKNHNYFNSLFLIRNNIKYILNKK